MYIYLGVYIWGHMIILCYFWGTDQLFSNMATQFCISTSSAQSPNFSASSPTLVNICLFDFFVLIIAILRGVGWYLIVVLISISQMTNDVEHLYVCVGHLYIFFVNMSIQVLAHFLIGLFVSLFLSYGFFIYSRYSTLTRHMIYKYSLPFYMLFLHFLDSLLWGANIFNFDEIQLSLFMFGCLCFGARNYYLIQRHKDLTLCLFLRGL